MSVIAMEKLTVISTAEHADLIVRRLMRLRAVSLRRGDGEEQAAVPDSFAPRTDTAAISARVARIEAAIKALTKYSRRRKRLFGSQTPISSDAFQTDGRSDTAWKIVDETNKILQGLAEETAKRDAIMTRINAFEPYAALEFPLSFTGTKTTVFFTGSLPGGIRPERIETALQGMAARLTVLSSDTTGTYVTVIAHRSEEDATLRVLSGLGFLRSPLPVADETVYELLCRAGDELERSEDELARLTARLSVLADKLDEVEILCDIERTALLAEENKQALAMTGQCVVLRGWCPVTERERVAAVLDGFCAAYEFESPSEGEEPPVLLKNNGFARNFEWVLGMYAYPKYGTFDPTLIMSIFYFLIFGLMFADAGYGLFLTLVCFGAVRWLHPRESMKRFLLMFGYCGISCTVFGVLLGSYFGNFPLAFMEHMMGIPTEELPRLSILPAEAANVAVLFDPIQNPMAFLVLSLGFGAVHLIAGMAVKAFILCREGKVLDALFDIVSYWILFAGIGTLFLSKKVGLILCLCGVTVIVLTAGRKRKGIPMKIAGGFLGLYDLINYASDLLSYSRILALGLAAGVIGQVVNILATLKGASFIGVILMLAVFAVGHLLNLVINVLGTFVHTSRLQYIEFFNKFYEEGGTPFKPMVPADKYTKDISHETDTSPSMNSADMAQD